MMMMLEGRVLNASLLLTLNHYDLMGYAQSILIIHGFHICDFTCFLTFICDPQINTLQRYSLTFLWAFVAVCIQ
jgi:hypothetical protein